MNFIKNILSSFIGAILGLSAVVLLLFLISIALISASEEPKTVLSNSILLLRLDGEVVDRSVEDPLAGFSSLLGSDIKVRGLNEIIGSIDRAKYDNNICGIYINTTAMSAGYSSILEIREALIDFKESGKFIYSYNDMASLKSYYLASVADSIIFNPIGMLEFQGLSTERMFYKGALDKLGVDYQMIRGSNNKYKSFVEQYTREDMSSESREQTRELLLSIWNNVLTDIGTSRDLDVAYLNEAADKNLTYSEIGECVSAGLIDNLKYKDEAINDILELAGLNKESDLNLIDVSDYFYSQSGVTPQGYIKNKVAVIYASGAIDGVSGDDNINSKKLSHTIREARNNDNIKAIVLRVNSPGGSAFGSEVIWREVMLTQKEKPVVVSMGDVAASGGYYIAAGAGEIMAEPTTITGSIGIFMAIPNVEGLVSDKLGLTFDRVGTNSHSDQISITRPFSDFEKRALQKSVDRGYQLFLTRVADNRGFEMAKADSVARGRVWTGETALELGLVDALGGLDDAIDRAKELADISEEEVAIISLPEKLDPFTEWVEEVTGGGMSKIYNSYEKRELGEIYNYYQELKQVTSIKGLQARLPYDINLK